MLRTFPSMGTSAGRKNTPDEAITNRYLVFYDRSIPYPMIDSALNRLLAASPLFQQGLRRM